MSDQRYVAGSPRWTQTQSRVPRENESVELELSVEGKQDIYV